MRIVATSDVHGNFPTMKIPDGDVLIIAGDILSDFADGHSTTTRFGNFFSMRSQLEELEHLNNHLSILPHKLKILIGGNHDFAMQKEEAATRKIITNGVYLRDEMYEFQGVKFYGHPWIPTLERWAFFADPVSMREKCDAIPDCDVLITHGGPWGILDVVPGARDWVGDKLVDSGGHCGCKSLARRTYKMRPKVHIFGHIHESYGQRESNGTRHFNVAHCDRSYDPVNPPAVIDL